MIRDLRAWEYHSLTFVFHFRSLFLSLCTHTYAHMPAYLWIYICVYIFIEKKKVSCMCLITRVGLHVCMCLHVKFKPRLLDKGKGKSFLLVCDFRGLRRLIKEKNNRFVCMFWVKYFSFAEKEGVKNTHCERGDEATARELLSVLPTLQNWGTTLPNFSVCLLWYLPYYLYLYIYSHFMSSTSLE